MPSSLLSACASGQSPWAERAQSLSPRTWGRERRRADPSSLTLLTRRSLWGLGWESPRPPWRRPLLPPERQGQWLSVARPALTRGRWGPQQSNSQQGSRPLWLSLPGPSQWGLGRAQNTGVKGLRPETLPGRLHSAQQGGGGGSQTDSPSRLMASCTRQHSPGSRWHLHSAPISRSRLSLHSCKIGE